MIVFFVDDELPPLGVGVISLRFFKEALPGSTDDSHSSGDRRFAGNSFRGADSCRDCLSTSNCFGVRLWFFEGLDSYYDMYEQKYNFIEVFICKIKGFFKVKYEIHMNTFTSLNTFT